MAPKSTPPARLPAEFRRRLLAWFSRQQRDLPWRRTRDPYRVLVSEIMLQQTQVTRVTEYYPRFLARFPTLQQLARARSSTVRETWDGLGYYRRAANLHRLARIVVRDHQGQLPDDPKRLADLPGIGPYTAGAVACFAFEQPVPAVDTNVARVLRRAFHPHLPPGSRGRQILWSTAQALQPRPGERAWRFNQALMELGALVCTARVARCSICPVRGACYTGNRDQRSAVRDQGKLH